MTDTIPHIIDTSRIVIQNIIPGKSAFEIYAPYVAVFVSLLTVAVNIWLNYKQIKNSHFIFTKEKKISNRKLLLEDYKLLQTKIIDTYLQIVKELEGNSFKNSSSLLDYYPLMRELSETYRRIGVTNNFHIEQMDKISSDFMKILFNMAFKGKVDLEDVNDLKLLIADYKKENNLFIDSENERILTIH